MFGKFWSYYMYIHAMSWRIAIVAVADNIKTVILK